MTVMKLASTNKAVPYNENTQCPTKKFHVLPHTALSQLLYSPVTVTISQTFLNDVKEYLNCI